MPRDRSRKYDSSDSSDSVYSQKSSRRKKSDRGRRSRSRDKYRYKHRSPSKKAKKSRRSNSRSPSRYYSSRKKSHSRDRKRSSSRDRRRSSSRDRRRSNSRDRNVKKRYSRSSSRSRSFSRERSKSREGDYSRNKYKKHKSSRHEPKLIKSRSVSPQNRDGLISLEQSKKYIVDDTVSKVEKAIKAAEAAGLKMCKLPTVEFKDVKVKEDMPTIQDRNVLNELNNEGFTPKSFTSSRPKKLPDNIVIDLEAGSIKVPDIEIPKVESAFHPDFFQDDKIRMEKWVKKMFLFRQKALKGDI